MLLRDGITNGGSKQRSKYRGAGADSEDGANALTRGESALVLDVIREAARGCDVRAQRMGVTHGRDGLTCHSTSCCWCATRGSVALQASACAWSCWSTSMRLVGNERSYRKYRGTARARRAELPLIQHAAGAQPAELPSC